MRWIAAFALALALSATAKAAPDAFDCPGRPWPQIGTVKVERTVANGEPRVTKTAHFAAANAIAPNERYFVLQSVSGRPGQRVTASSYATMGRLSCLYDYRYEWIARRGKPFRVMGISFMRRAPRRTARALRGGSTASWRRSIASCSRMRGACGVMKRFCSSS